MELWRGEDLGCWLVGFGGSEVRVRIAARGLCVSCMVAMRRFFGLDGVGVVF